MNAAPIEALGDSALLIRLGDRLDSQTNRAALALAAALRAAPLPGVLDIAPAYASVTVRYDPAAASDGRPGAAHERVARWIRETAGNVSTGSAAAATPGNSAAADAIVEVPVCYGGAFGADLDAVAAHAGLSAGEVVARHAQPLYRVAMLGFMPGFAYLLGLDASLHTPRRASPRTRVPRGSVAIGGAQTGIYPRDSPGGWQLIGRTPLALFDPARATPALLQPGQCVRFLPIDADRFAASPA